MAWLDKLKSGLKKSRQLIGDTVRKAFAEKGAALQIDEIFDSLIQGDVGIETSEDICNILRKQRLNSVDVALQEIAKLITENLTPASQPFHVERGDSTHVVLVSGVNGSGKTTSIAKLTKQCLAQGLTVEWAACDTFRAAAVEQLCVWGERLNVPVYTTYPGQRERVDPAALAYHAFEQARRNRADVLFLDTAGRLQNNESLMRELGRVANVLAKVDATAPHQSLLVIDGTTGQNAYLQVDLFKSFVPVTGLVITKLDGTSKAGFLIGLYKKTKIPVVAIGVGEQMDDLNVLDAQLFAQSLLGL
ncbi:MAG: signal recognition particle-docking protein FtsY [Holosporales bacterium]|jgi:fused signal recognition particle receptor|nr:signal recognition particle-docking protein FtsY [Holosporales bacterium]